jgi:subtilase family protein/dockerin type I repeat protein
MDLDKLACGSILVLLVLLPLLPAMHVEGASSPPIHRSSLHTPSAVATLTDFTKFPTNPNGYQISGNIFTLKGWGDQSGWWPLGLGFASWVDNRTLQPAPEWSQYNGSGIKIAILDIGTNTTIPDLSSVTNLNPSTQEVSACDPSFVRWAPLYIGFGFDISNHGTSTATMISAKKDGQGLVGLAYGATLYSINVQYLNSTAGFANPIITDCSIAAGLDQARALGVNIVSMSLAFAGINSCNDPRLKPVLEGAIVNAYNNGMLLVASAGNSGGDSFATNPGQQSTVWCPASDPRVVSVGSIGDLPSFWNAQAGNLGTSFTYWTERSAFSSWGPKLDLMAPGENILTWFPKFFVYNGGPYSLVSGTSYSAPLAAAYFAHLFQKGITRDQIVGDLQGYALEESGSRNVFYGLGRLDASLVNTPLAGPRPPLGSYTTYQEIQDVVLQSINVLPYNETSGVQTLLPQATPYFSTQGGDTDLKVGVDPSKCNAGVTGLAGFFTSLNMTWKIVTPTLNETGFWNFLAPGVQNKTFAFPGQSYAQVTFGWTWVPNRPLGVAIELKPCINTSFDSTQVLAPASATLVLDSSSVTVKGGLIIDKPSFIASGRITVSAVNKTTGIMTFSRNYTISNLPVSELTSTIFQTKLLLDVSVLPYHLSVDLNVQSNGGTGSVAIELTRELDIAGSGSINIVDLIRVAVAFSSTVGSPNYDPRADVNGDGVINISDLSQVAFYFTTPAFY